MRTRYDNSETKIYDEDRDRISKQDKGKSEIYTGTAIHTKRLRLQIASERLARYARDILPALDTTAAAVVHAHIG